MKIIIVVLLIILLLVKYAEYALYEIRELKKRQFVYRKLLNLNTEHDSAFFYYKLIPSDYDNMIIEAREKGICLTKEEIDSFYKRFMSL
ncbi:hypothetical protein [Lachnospira multipara]|uniref:Uncharacterized protein n=1 Tax=Lachnospira multipara TaxID=28051 RepID=A0A1H5VRK8_9FIRM|nr:hypothetical protein [Lachnospira multipara]SEF89864.1 hypothetical protein SAMN05216537_11252 [Lachnospira multipara]